MVGVRGNRLELRRRRERMLLGRIGRLFASLTVLAAVLVLPLRGGAPPQQSADVVMARLSALSESSPGSGDQPSGRQVLPAVRITSSDELFVPVGHIEIPKAELAVPIFNGVQSGILEQGVGQWPGTPPSRLVLSGHRTTYGAPFRDLDLLSPGDEILVSRGRNQPARYEVFETLIVPEAEYVDSVLDPFDGEPQAIVTLFACHPKGARTHRIVVRARSDDPSLADASQSGLLAAPGG